MNQRFRTAWYLLIAGLVLPQCTIEDCVSIRSEEAIIIFADTANETEDILSPTWDSVYGVGANFEVYGDTSLQNWILPMNPARDSVAFVFVSYGDTDTTRDTLGLTYRTLEQVLGLNCGYEILYNDLEVYYHTFDSARVVDSSLTRENEVNVYLYQFSE
ncbi:MAG TPA: hypothetical protein DCE41_15920 [Cytophagales bacterium]|nr:hypothetical protein [Cytophagales bacterium]HAA22827.1 hypothetical protein [Cytophagales bacterium]HAP64468.1 hypothetical protein [Cytophagales bacterium]